MNRLLLTSYLSLTTSLALSQPKPNTPYSLQDLQGLWWSDCSAPAADFVIQNNEYSGDFEGSYPLTLAGDLLTFTEGFADGHSIEVTHEALTFRIVQLSGDTLTLRRLSASQQSDDWQLRDCE